MADMTWQDELAAVCQQTERSILAGPFRQEFGFEVLYWIPFLNWARETYKIKPERLIVATRGGAGVYYKVPTGIELYRLRTVQELRTGNIYDWQANKSLKQSAVTDFDMELIQGAEYDLRQKLAVLSPALMHAACERVWNEQAPRCDLFNCLRFAPLPLPPLPAGLTLPLQFTVVRLYSRHTLPHRGHVHHWARGVVKKLCERGPVVLLEPPYIADDHLTFAIADGAGQPYTHPNLLRVREAITPDDGLAIQGAIIGRAQQYVGTYGGMQQLALMLGIPSVGYYSEWAGTLPIHLEISQRLARERKVPFYVFCVDDEARLRAVL